MLMYPDANIPIVEISILSSLDPAKHVQIGQAISSLRDEGVADFRLIPSSTLMKTHQVS